MKNIQKQKIKKFVKNIDENIKVKFAKAFECDIEENTIFIETKRNKANERLFKKWYEKYFNEKLSKKNLFYISLLHEIGHLMTYTKELDTERDDQYSLIGTKLMFGLISQEQANNEYFIIPMELKATEWARNYLKNYIKGE